MSATKEKLHMETKQEIKLEDIFNDEKRQGVKELIDKHKQEAALKEALLELRKTPMTFEPEQETLEKLADKWVFETNGHKWSNNNNEAGDNFGSFIAGFKEAEKTLYSEEEFRNTLLDINLVNPSHLQMTSNGHGEFPDGYKLTQKGVDYIIEQFKKK